MNCKKCGTDYADVNNNFYAHGEDTEGRIRRDVVCKYCRRIEAREYRATGKYKVPRLPKDLSTARRNTPESFRRYMLQSPGYFRTLFNKPPSERNIQAAFREAQDILRNYHGWAA